MSSRPIVFPSSDVEPRGPGALGGDAFAGGIEKDAHGVISLQIGLTAHLAVRPAGDDRREETRAATRVHDVQAVRA